jgi:hypothetical protein
MRGPFRNCCARAASGQPSAAPPRSVTNSRRLMGTMGALLPFCANLPQSDRQVPGTDLNCSESSSRRTAALYRAIVWAEVGSACFVPSPFRVLQELPPS